MSRLINKIKESEGFKGVEYLDSLNIPTIGFGTRLPLTEAEAELILSFRLNQMISHLLEVKPLVLRLPQDKQEVLFEMVYQMGVNGVLNFKMMWLALENFKYNEASVEMIDSLWAKQTPNRANKLAEQMKS